MFWFTHSNFFNLLKWFCWATLIGILVGGVDALFLKTLDHSLRWTHQFPLYYLGLPVCLYVVYLLSRRLAPQADDYATDAIIHKINTHQPVGLGSAVKAFCLSIFTMAAGGSAGKEAPCADAGAGLACAVAQLFHFNAEDRRKLMICGVSAGFAGVFGVPISGALFGLEVLWVGHIFYEVMFPAFIAGITAFQITTYLGVNYIYHPMQFAPVFAEQFFLKVLVAGICFGLVSIMVTELLKLAQVLFRYITLKTSAFWRCFIGGTLLVLIGFLISPSYLGLGVDGFNQVLSGAALESPFGFLFKSITTAITFAAGGVGGIITPIFFIGAQAGAAFAGWLGTDPATMAALGLVAVLAGAANTPLSASIMAIELFGAPIAPYAAVACVISFLMSGRHSVYASQKMSFDKQKETAFPSATHGERIALSKGWVLKFLKDLSKHLIPNPAGFDKEEPPYPKR